MAYKGVYCNQIISVRNPLLANTFLNLPDYVVLPPDVSVANINIGIRDAKPLVYTKPSLSRIFVD